MSLVFSVFTTETNITNLASRSQHTILPLFRKKYINKRTLWLACSRHADLVRLWLSAHACTYVSPGLWRLWASIHRGWKSMILQDQIVWVSPEVFISRRLQPNEAPAIPPLHTHAHFNAILRPHPPSRLVLHSTCPDADVFSTGYSLAIGRNSSLVSPFFIHYETEVLKLFTTSEKNWCHEMQADTADWNTTRCIIFMRDHKPDCRCLNSRVNIWIDFNSMARINF